MNETIIALLFAVATPIIVGQAKKYAPRIPKHLLPHLAVVVGPLLELGRALIFQQAPDSVIMALSGPGGIGARELVDQTLKALGIRPEKKEETQETKRP